MFFSGKYFFVLGVKLRVDADHGPGGGDEAERLQGGVTGPESKQDPVMMFVCLARGNKESFHHLYT